MKKTITLSTFRKIGKAEDFMMRAVMPRTPASTPTSLNIFPLATPQTRTVWRNGVRSVETVTFSEVANG